MYYSIWYNMSIKGREENATMQDYLNLFTLSGTVKGFMGSLEEGESYITIANGAVTVDIYLSRNLADNYYQKLRKIARKFVFVGRLGTKDNKLILIAEKMIPL